jgi:hypothetical protein
MKDKIDTNTLDWVDEEDIDEIDFNEEVDWSVCPTCGYTNEEDDIFCNECGTRLKGDPDE